MVGLEEAIVDVLLNRVGERVVKLMVWTADFIAEYGLFQQPTFSTDRQTTSLPASSNVTPRLRAINDVLLLSSLLASDATQCILVRLALFAVVAGVCCLRGPRHTYAARCQL